MRAAEQDPAKRAAWWQQVQHLDVWQLVFIDECGVNTAMRRTHARAPRGQRAVGSAPRNWKHNTTILGALSPQGVQAVMSLEAATDTLAFEAFIEQVLLPTLVPGQIVVLDSLSAHKSARAKALVEEAGCFWFFLPPYSPDFNPIEMVWSPFKHHLRSHEPRDQNHLDELIWPILSQVTPQHAQNCFAHAGYHLSRDH